MKVNLLSAGKVTKNFKMVFQNNVAEIYNIDNCLTAVAEKINDIYILTCRVIKDNVQPDENDVMERSKKRFCHKKKSGIAC